MKLWTSVRWAAADAFSSDGHGAILKRAGLYVDATSMWSPRLPFARRVSAGAPAYAAAVVMLLAALALAGCGSGGDDAGDDHPIARPELIVGFVYVGSVRDHGYNEAAYRGSLAVERAFPRARILQAQDVPESEAAAGVMQRMVDRGATIIFPTSFGHLQAALEVAARNPSVTFLHQGGLQTAMNLGTYFATIWQAQYAAGQAAGLSTRSDRLGFVAAFPIAQSLLSINAFQIGARSVNPRVRTRVLFTSSWCAPRAQRAAARRLLAWGADVLGQHQDCTAAVIRAAAAAGARTTGFHVDAHRLAPKAWLTGSVWNWGPLYVDMVRSVVAGHFAHSPYASRYRATIADGTVGLASFGDAATPAIRRRVRATFGLLRSGDLQPFAGPLRDQRGRLRIRGDQPSTTVLEETDYLVEGVLGTTTPRG
ncbi:MAG: basic rane protein [Solirubrobacteraceae bacterium]|nr:basic rane protein [Solirubrobacteraceae bacterium]